MSAHAPHPSWPAAPQPRQGRPATPPFRPTPRAGRGLLLAGLVGLIQAAWAGESLPARTLSGPVPATEAAATGAPQSFSTPGTPAAAQEAAPLFATSSNDLAAEAAAARREGRRLVVAFTLPDCPGCREMGREVFPDPATRTAFARRFHTVQVDLAASAPLVGPDGQSWNRVEFAQSLHAYATPSFAFFDDQGAFLYRHTGTLDRAEFLRLGDYVASAAYEERPFVPGQASAPQSTAGKPPKATGTPLALRAEAPDPSLPRHPQFRLTDSQGQSRRLSDFRGRVVALAVGYTRCPDVCPTTLSSLKAALEALPERLRRRVQVIFATLDPERDSPALLAEYTAAFAPRGGLPFLGLRGNPEETQALIHQLSLVAEKRPAPGMDYTLDHTAGIFLIDAQGKLQGLAPYDGALADLRADLATLAAGAPPGKALAPRAGHPPASPIAPGVNAARHGSPAAQAASAAPARVPQELGAPPPAPPEAHPADRSGPTAQENGTRPSSSPTGPGALSALARQ